MSSITTTIDGFISNFIGGARPNQFRINIPDLDQRYNLHCRASSLPSSNVGNIQVPYRGRRINIPGDRSFDSWAAVFYNDVDFNSRRFFETWSAEISGRNDVTSRSSRVDLAFKDITITQLDRTDKEIAVYTLYSAWPVNVSEVSLSMDAENAIEEYSVTFAYQYWEVVYKDPKIDQNRRRPQDRRDNITRAAESVNVLRGATGNI